MAALAQPTAPSSSSLCTNCGTRPKAVRVRGGQRKRLKLCRECLLERAAERGVSLPESPEVVAHEQAVHAPRQAHGTIKLCGATSKQTGEPCQNVAGKGTDHVGYGRCKFHGGNSPHGRRFAYLQMAQADAISLAAPIDIDPMNALLWCVRIAAGEVAYFTMQVSLLSKTEIQGPVVSTKTRPRKGEYGMEEHGDEVTEIEQGHPALHIWIKARQDAIDRLAKYSKMASDAGVNERQVELAERYGELIGRVVGNILDALHLTPKQQKRAPEIVRRYLSDIEGTGALVT